MPLDTRPIVVVGGTGFVGRAIVRELFYSGQHVRVVARRVSTAEDVLPGELEPGDPLEVQNADIGDAESLKPVLEGARAVINVVGLYTESKDIRFHDVHVEGASRLAYLARQAGVEQYLLMSGIGARSDSPSPYIRARAEGEQAVMAEMARAVILRPSALYAEHGGFLPGIARLARLPMVPLFGQGQSRLQPLHLGDLASAVTRLVCRSDTPRMLFEFGGPDPFTYRELILQVARHLEREPRLVPVPMLLWHALAKAMSGLPSPPLTRDMLWLVSEDNLVGEGVGTFADLGIKPRSLRDSLPYCLPRS